MSKKIIVFIFVLLCLNLNLNAKSLHIYIKPSAGIFHPDSRILRSYYDLNFIFSYGVEADVLTNFYNIGGYVSFNRFSVKIKDKQQPDLKETSAWYNFGLIKRWTVNSIFIDFKSGLTIHNDQLSDPFSNETHYGYQMGIAVGKIIFKKAGVFLETTYNHESRKVPYYVTYTYSRRQVYLSDKRFNTGGFIIQSGISLSLN